MEEILDCLVGWSSYKRAYFVQRKLKDAAKNWFNYLDDCGLAWDQWKAELKKAFPRREDFGTQLEEFRLEIRKFRKIKSFFFTINGITEEVKKKVILLNSLSEECYILVRNLCVPDLLKDKSFGSLNTKGAFFSYKIAFR